MVSSFKIKKRKISGSYIHCRFLQSQCVGDIMVDKIDGIDVLKNFLEQRYSQYSFKDLEKQDDPSIQTCIKEAIDILGIWLPVELYKYLPIISPFVKRDNSCRPLKKNQIDMWGSPDEEGYFRDDNSIVKGYPRSLLINSTFPSYAGKKIGKGFVTAHCWMCKNNNYNPMVNSFVPNLVWLPKPLAVLTDVEGSFAQQYVQFLSYNIYVKVRVNRVLSKTIKECWSLLPKPYLSLPRKKVVVNFFEYKPRMQKSRISIIKNVQKALELCIAGEKLSKKVISKRYTDGLPNVSKEHLIRLNIELKNYLKTVEEASSLASEKV